ncbi:fimbria/pilus periplasmic chaperone [Citrobacter sedlakii]|uniref:fimbria/pilus periplasmic chaperone n=1 Tax=Citrobacter sedlakii TaxID=67826 RepID=UPI002B22F9DD|nr:fimbria/pilus periplasmic chaperone [Citrobacter sedlakii]MEB0952380.1 fimbria/pilus periplasmic chaperone [Citrobacter sedlakii]
MKGHLLTVLVSCAMGTIGAAQAAVSPDRTRLVFKGDDKSISVDLKNASEKMPYLAQSWIEDEKGVRISSPLTVVPPVQRIEAKSIGQARIQGMPGLAALPQDRESLFFYNVREIPPKSDAPNTLQIALQTRIKLFYRPVSLAKVDPMNPWQYDVVLEKKGGQYQVNNTTGYYVIVSDASRDVDGETAKGFTPMVIAPQTSKMMVAGIAELGNTPVLTYVNDYGARLPLIFNCSAEKCTVNKEKSRKS